jgi:hypothetical protein
MEAVEDFTAAEAASTVAADFAAVGSEERDLASVSVSAWRGLMELTATPTAMATIATLTTTAAATWFGGG